MSIGEISCCGVWLGIKTSRLSSRPLVNNYNKLRGCRPFSPIHSAMQICVREGQIYYSHILNIDVLILNAAFTFNYLSQSHSCRHGSGSLSDSRGEGEGPLIRPTAAFTSLGFHWPGRSILGFRLTHICSENLLWRMRVWVTDF